MLLPWQYHDGVLSRDREVNPSETEAGVNLVFISRPSPDAVILRGKPWITELPQGSGSIRDQVISVC